MVEPNPAVDETADTKVFVLPSLGSDMESGTIIEWLVAPGDTVRRGDVLLRVDTEKSDIDVETWDDGVVAELLVEPGVEVLVGAALARITAAPSSTSPPTPPPAPPPTLEAGPNSRPPEPAVQAPAPVADLTSAPPEASGTSGDGFELPFISPRTVYWPLQRDTRANAPTGPPVDARSPAPATFAEAARDATRGEPPDRMRTAIARLMSKSNQEIPHYHLMHDIDVSNAVAWLTAENETRPVQERIVLAALLVKAAACAIDRHDELHGSWIDGRFVAADTVRVGVAVHLRTGGLLTPSLEAPNDQPLDTVMAQLREVTGRARRGDLRSSDMAPATITITNLGDRGANAVLGVINPPQVALVGFGAVHDVPAAVDGEVVIRSVVTTTLSADHRATDGHSGSAFLTTLNDLLQRPEELN